MKISVKTFKPLHDYVSVLIPKLSQKTKAGIIKTEAMVQAELKDIPQVFEVLAVGDKVENIRPGQYVLCTRINQVPFDSEKEGFEVAVVRVFDIVGVFNDLNAAILPEDEPETTK